MNATETTPAPTAPLTYVVGPTTVHMHAGLYSLKTEIVRTSPTSAPLTSSPAGWTRPTSADVDARWLTRLSAPARDAFAATFTVEGERTEVEIPLRALVPLRLAALVVDGQITDLGRRIRALIG